MKFLGTWTAAIAGLMMILIGALAPSGVFIPSIGGTNNVIALPSTWQIPSLLVCGFVCGSKPGSISVIAYLIIGLFYLPVFHGGGSTGYLLTPDMGYLFGFLPAVWVSGRLSEQKGKDSLIHLTLYSLFGLGIIHIVGIVHIILGSLISLWPRNAIELIFSYSIAPLPSQAILCAGAGISSKFLRLLLFK